MQVKDNFPKKTVVRVCLWASIIGIFLTMPFCIESTLVNENMDLYTDNIRYEDSIKIVRNSNNLIENLVIKDLKKKTKKYDICSINYIDTMQAYKVRYRYNLKDSTLSLGKWENDKAIWIRLNFEYNNGFYKITPYKIKSCKYEY